MQYNSIHVNSKPDIIKCYEEEEEEDRCIGIKLFLKKSKERIIQSSGSCVSLGRRQWNGIVEEHLGSYKLVVMF